MSNQKTEREFQEKIESIYWGRIFYAVLGIMLVVIVGSSTIAYILLNPKTSTELKSDEIASNAGFTGPAVVNGIDVESSLIAKGDYLVVKQNCTSCHSGKLITQNRMDRESWVGTIRWMQETQNLGPLYDNEEKILDYFEKYYPPQKKGRRQRLQNIEWYELK